VHDLRIKYEARLGHERNEALRLKGENGIMNKKFASLQKEIDEQREEIQTLFANKKDLYAQIASLEKVRARARARPRGGRRAGEGAPQPSGCAPGERASARARERAPPAASERGTAGSGVFARCRGRRSSVRAVRRPCHRAQL
jgi:septal ring factor EnvC (AmiA/AmiB activator)